MTNVSPDTPNLSPPTPVDFKTFLTLFASIMLPMFLAIVDQTIVAAALPAIAGDLGSVERVSWVVIAYLVATTISAPVYGRLGDHLGRRSMMLVALTIMVCASILCGLARNIEMLTAARVLQGFGGGGLLTLSQALIGEVLPPRDRARYQGILATVGVGSSAFGAVIGGLLTEYLGWRSSSSSACRSACWRSSWCAGCRYGRIGPAVPLRLCRSCSLCRLHRLVARHAAQSADARRERRAAGGAAPGDERRGVRPARLVGEAGVEPAAADSLLRRPAIWRSDALATCHGAVLVSLLTFLPIYLRVVHGAAADKIGLFLFPVAGGVSLGSMTTGWLVGRQDAPLSSRRSASRSSRSISSRWQSGPLVST